MPGGYYKRTSSKGSNWVGTVSWGGSGDDSGSSDFSYAYAGPDGMVATAGRGGHAVAVSGSGSRYEAKIMGPGGQIIHRRADGSTRRGKFTYSEENQEAIRDIGENHRALRHIDRNQEAMMYGEDNHRASRNSDENHRATKNVGENRRHRDKNHRAMGYDDEELGALRYREAIRYSKKKQEAITFGNENRRAIGHID